MWVNRSIPGLEGSKNNAPRPVEAQRTVLVLQITNPGKNVPPPNSKRL
jgi:hypothetical protein